MVTKKTAATKKPATTTTPKRTNRTAAERIADLKVEIERIQQRDAAKQVRASDDGKAFITAVKAVGKALDAAREVGNDDMAQALTTAHAALAGQLVDHEHRRLRRVGRRRAQNGVGGLRKPAILN